MSIFRPRPPQVLSDITAQPFGGSSSPFANTSSESFSQREYDDPDYAHLGLDDQPEEEEDLSNWVVFFVIGDPWTEALVPVVKAHDIMYQRC